MDKEGKEAESTWRESSPNNNLRATSHRKDKTGSWDLKIGLVMGLPSRNLVRRGRIQMASLCFGASKEPEGMGTAQQLFQACEQDSAIP